MDHDDILAEAYAATAGARQSEYGPPEVDLGRTAGMLTSLFRDMLLPGQSFTHEHVAMMLCCVKLSRLRQTPTHRDSWVDLAGYARCGWLCARGQPQPRATDV